MLPLKKQTVLNESQTERVCIWRDRRANMRKKNKKSFIFICIVLFSSILILIRMKVLGSTNYLAGSSVTPTVFVHGYKGGERSFGTMLSRFETYGWGEKIMVIRISNTGRITTSGDVKPHTEHPFIQVIFENSRASIHDQAKWLDKTMKLLKDKYHIGQVNLVGHSMGGLALTSYLEHISTSPYKYPVPKKLITIGSPFKGVYQEGYFERNTGEALIDLHPDSKALQRLVENKGNFPGNIPVLSIAGVTFKSQIGDGLVSKESAGGNQSIVPKQNFIQETVNDPNATHSGLHEHQDVDRMIGEFLWGIKN